MPASDWDEMMAAAAAEVLETMFFTEVYPTAGGPPVGPRVTTRVQFEGTPSGALTLRVSEKSARALAANFLASEDDDPMPERGCVVCELANMICGSMLSRVGSEECFRLSSPELLPEGAGADPPNQSLRLGDGLGEEPDGDAGDVMDLWLTLEPHVQ